MDILSYLGFEIVTQDIFHASIDKLIWTVRNQESLFPVGMQSLQERTETGIGINIFGDSRDHVFVEIT